MACFYAFDYGGTFGDDVETHNGFAEENFDLNSSAVGYSISFNYIAESEDLDESDSQVTLYVMLKEPDGTWHEIKVDSYVGGDPINFWDHPNIILHRYENNDLPATWFDNTGQYTIRIKAEFTMGPGGSANEMFIWNVDHIYLRRLEGSHTTDWRDRGENFSAKTLWAHVEIGENQSVKANVQVSNDGSTVLDNKIVTLYNGLNN